MEQREQDRSEQPTSFKLMRSRKKGIVARSNDLGFFTAIAVFAAFCAIAGAGFATGLAHLFGVTLVTAGGIAGDPDSLLGFTGSMLGRIGRPLALFSAAVFLAVLLLEVAQTGFVFSAAPLTPDFARLNPSAGLKRIFTLRMLIETGKNVLKLAAYSLVAWLAVLPGLRTAAITDATGLVAGFGSSAFRLVTDFAALACLFALLDQFLARRLFLKQMRMSRRELRREQRDREGEPRIKQKRKQLHGQLAKLGQGLRAVRGSDVVITNPTELAVALKYQPELMDAPTVVARGAQDLARRIRRLAFTFGVIVIEDKALAQDLYRRCAVGRPIPEDQFRRVAAIYRKLRNRARNGEMDA